MRLVHFCTALTLLSLWTGCRSGEAPENYAARVSDSYLTANDLQKRISDYPALRDTASARRHIINSWVTEQLLYREARRQDVAADSTVQARLNEARRSVLIDALVQNLKADVPPPSETSIQSYYQRHREEMRLQEPFLRVLYVAGSNRDSLQALRAELSGTTDSTAVDSIWQTAIDHHARDAEQARRLSENYLPQSRLERELPTGPYDLAGLSAGDVSPLLETNGAYHFVHVGDRMPEGTVPPLAQVRDKILQQLMIQEKKLMYTREVQRLRTRARANNSIEVPE